MEQKKPNFDRGPGSSGVRFLETRPRGHDSRICIRERLSRIKSLRNREVSPEGLGLLDHLRSRERLVPEDRWFLLRSYRNPETISQLANRASNQESDQATATAHGDDPIVIGERPCSREQLADWLASRLDIPPDKVGPKELVHYRGQPLQVGPQGPPVSFHGPGGP